MALCSLSTIGSGLFSAAPSGGNLSVDAILPGQTTASAIGISPSGQSIAFVNTSRNVFVSTDYGASFTQVADVTATTAVPIFIRVSDDGRYMAAYTHYQRTLTNNAVAISTDGGASWALALAASGTDVRVFSVSVSASGQYWCISGDGTDPGIYMNNNFGHSASWVKTTMAAAQGNDMSANGQYILVAGNGAPAKYSSDYGVSFGDISTNNVYGRNPACSNDGLFAVLLAAGQPFTAYYSTALDIAAPITNAAASTISTRIQHDSSDTVFVNSDGSECFFINRASDAGQYQIHVSRDNLQTSVPYLPSSLDVSKISVSATTKYMVAWNTGGQLYRITNNELPSPPAFTASSYAASPVTYSTINKYCMAISRNGKYVAVKLVTNAVTTSYSIYVSSDSGLTYTNVYTNASNPNGIDVSILDISNNGRYIMHTDFTGASSTRSVRVSSDGGASFSAPSSGGTGLTLTYGQRHAMSASGQTIAFLLNNNSSTGNVYVSNDYGSTWAFTTFGSQGNNYPYHLSMDKSGQYIALATASNAPGRFFLSSDFGASFTQVTSATGYGTDAYLDADASVVVYGVGFGSSTVLYSTDLSTFTTVTGNTTMQQLQGSTRYNHWLVNSGDPATPYVFINTSNQMSAVTPDFATTSPFWNELSAVSRLSGTDSGNCVLLQATKAGTTGIYLVQTGEVSPW